MRILLVEDHPQLAESVAQAMRAAGWTVDLLHDGVDWETKHAQAVKEAEARREAGLAVPGAAPAPATVQTPAPDPAGGNAAAADEDA